MVAPLTNVTLNDPMLGINNLVMDTTIQPGEVYYFYAEGYPYTVTRADMQAGEA